MKKIAYETPIAEIVLFKTEDIIVTSGDGGITAPDFGDGGTVGRE